MEHLNRLTFKLFESLLTSHKSTTFLKMMSFLY